MNRKPESAAPAQAWIAATIFSSAFLLFLVQPLIAKQILPWFGGSAAVWSVCMVFFQVVLLAGYAYADWLTRRPARTQALLHTGLLLASLACLPIVADARWKPAGSDDPTLAILGLLALTIGPPYLLLSTTGPLVQAWVSRLPWGGRVYRYFSLSNLASLASLLAYPVLIEPRHALRVQALGWSWGYVLFALLCIGTAWHVARRGGAAPAAATEAATEAAQRGDDALPTPADQALWLLLPALACGLLLAVTNHITQHVASIPFLWVLPLAVYLLSFVLTFESDRWYRRAWFLSAGALAIALCAYGLQDSLGTRLRTAVPLYVGGLFVLSMCLHGEMARRRPAPRHLTRFYLMLSLGGAAGGIAVGLLAPLLLPNYYELGALLTLTALAGALVLRAQRRQAALALALAALAGHFLWVQVRDDHEGTRELRRNFYGTLLTMEPEREQPQDAVRQLYHGSVKHGEQFLRAERRGEPTAYYGPNSGVGLAIAAAPQGPRRVGLIGLGVGTLATYARPGDVYRFYEINPQVFELADSEFHFLADSRARIERVLGDARLQMEAETAQGYDVLAVDAFSGGAVPVHLLTAEAMDAYFRHVKAGGVVAFHVTNRFLDLPPVVLRTAELRGLHALRVHDEGDDVRRRTDWVLVARDAATLAPFTAYAKPIEADGVRGWTDDFNDLFSVLK
jgi:predicted O-methyltransferase YrrM